MKNRLVKLALLFLIALMISCNQNSKKKFEKLQQISWLEGNWENKLDDGLLIEKWKKNNDSVYLGKSYFIRGNDTLHFESIELIQRNDDLLYIPTVKGQNNNEPIEFKLSKSTENTFTFENSSHDYPQTIEYKKVTNSQLSATVSGNQDGKVSSDVYLLNKK